MSSNTPGAIDAHVGRQLKARRRQLKLKQADLAQAVQVSTQQVHKYETAKSSLPAAKLLKLAQTLGVSPAYFYDGLEADAASGLPVRAGRSGAR